MKTKIIITIMLIVTANFSFAQKVKYNWGPWNKVPCYQGLEWSIKRSDDNSINKDGNTTWVIKYRNYYSTKIYFRFNLTNRDGTNPSGGGRTGVPPGEQTKSDTWFLLTPDNYKLFSISQVRFGDDFGPGYADCDVTPRVANMGYKNQQKSSNGNNSSDNNTANNNTYKNEIFNNPDIPATYPGGATGWQSFLMSNLIGSTPTEHGAKPGLYKVIIKFVVNKDGTVSNIEAETNFGFGMENEAIRVIKKSGLWKPATIDNKPVNTYRRQTIIFQVTEL